jgi:hypothetical protein
MTMLPIIAIGLDADSANVLNRSADLLTDQQVELRHYASTDQARRFLTSPDGGVEITEGGKLRAHVLYGVHPVGQSASDPAEARLEVTGRRFVVGPFERPDDRPRQVGPDGALGPDSNTLWMQAGTALRAHALINVLVTEPNQDGTRPIDALWSQLAQGEV